jgi:hypothetical protein
VVRLARLVGPGQDDALKRINVGPYRERLYLDPLSLRERARVRAASRRSSPTALLTRRCRC